MAENMSRGRSLLLDSSSSASSCSALNKNSLTKLGHNDDGSLCKREGRLLHDGKFPAAGFGPRENFYQISSHLPLVGTSGFRYWRFVLRTPFSLTTSYIPPSSAILRQYVRVFSERLRSARAAEVKPDLKSLASSFREKIAAGMPGDADCTGRAMKAAGRREDSVPLSEVVADCVRRWFRDALEEAKAGDAAMQVLVGQMYQSGYGVPRNEQKEEDILERRKLEAIKRSTQQSGRRKKRLVVMNARSCHIQSNCALLKKEQGKRKNKKVEGNVEQFRDLMGFCLKLKRSAMCGIVT
ncbi:hypothetical protein AXF42_Ash004737 [Apostasia shenzhenica]|uniref:Uncharacterized protein n=1 Tax=Apostasia shenzhenica TaxID=1088818 RepID=A0A2I0BHH8_9ASPA|nr:hypothetical protein AXF42_Ash004737 [Apostasia shenzhenica]